MSSSCPNANNVRSQKQKLDNGSNSTANLTNSFLTQRSNSLYLLITRNCRKMSSFLYRYLTSLVTRSLQESNETKYYNYQSTKINKNDVKFQSLRNLRTNVTLRRREKSLASDGNPYLTPLFPSLYLGSYTEWAIPAHTADSNLLKSWIRTSQKLHFIYITEAKRLMLFM
jgi:hypothetical protein